MGIRPWQLTGFVRELIDKKICSLNRAVKLLGITKNSYYQSKNPEDRFLKKYDGLKQKVKKILASPGCGCYGIRRIKAKLLRKYDIVIDKDALSKLLKLWGLELKRKIKRRKPSWIEKILKIMGSRSNLLKTAKTEKPLQAVSSDITELLFKNGKAYLAIHKDVFAQTVYGWNLGLNMGTDLILVSQKRAVKNIKKIFKIETLPKELIWHQDQGSQYTSYEYAGQILKHGRLSYSEVATPTDNPGQESFFGRLKDEYKCEIKECKNIQELKKLISKIIKNYNYQRLHTSIGYQPPMAYLKSLLKSPETGCG